MAGTWHDGTYRELGTLHNVTAKLVLQVTAYTGPNADIRIDEN
jgi:hypothetical protein